MDDRDDYLEQLQEIAFDLLDKQNQRDELIIDAYDAGCTLREIAEALGVSHMTVQRVVRPPLPLMGRLAPE